MALTGMLAEVTADRLKGPLQQRTPELVESDVPEHLVRLEGLVRGAAVRVVLLTGPDPVPGPFRDLAVEAVVLETASRIEYAEYPEQQTPGDEGRGWHLHQQYLELLAEIRGIVDSNGGTPPSDGGAGPAVAGGLPRATFPAPSAYPDPIQVRGFNTDVVRRYEERTP
jgi:hypothetical protein